MQRNIEKYIIRSKKVAHSIGLLLNRFDRHNKNLVTSKGYSLRVSARPWLFFVFLGTEITYAAIMIRFMYRRNAKSYWINIGSSAEVYMKNIGSLANTILSKNKNRFDLILSDGDWCVTNPETLSLTINIFALPHLRYVYVQNIDLRAIPAELRNKAKLIPIGLDVHTKRLGLPTRHLYRLIERTTPHGERRMKILVDFKNSISHPIRKKIIEEIRDNANFEILEDRIDQEQLWELYKNYLAVLSPPGGGADCHRTWEALVFGSIPVVFDSHLNEMINYAGGFIVNGIDDLKDENIVHKLLNHKEHRVLRPALYSDYLK